MISDALWIWLRAVILFTAIIVLFCGGCVLIDGVRWILALGRSRLVRTDRPRSGTSCPSDSGDGISPPQRADVAGDGPRGTVAAPDLTFDLGYTAPGDLVVFEVELTEAQIADLFSVRPHLALVKPVSDDEASGFAWPYVPPRPRAKKVIH